MFLPPALTEPVMQKRIDIFFSLFFMVFCAVSWMQILDLPPADDSGDAGMGFFPSFCVLCILLFSLILLGRTLIFRGVGGKAPSPLSRESRMRLAGVLVLMLVYSLAYEWIGFYISTWLFGAALLLFIGERRPLVVALYPAALTLFVYAGFVELLGVVLPVGELMYELFPSFF